MGANELDALSAVMQKYCFSYTATHDFKVADLILADDYTFHMGEHTFRGREAAYKPAADRQFKAYPGLGLTVHDFFSNGDRCAMYFSEHGYSIQFGCQTAWHGVSIYRWNGARLTECRIEQDYYGRRRQLTSRIPDPIDRPAHAPWTEPVNSPNATNEQLVTEWLQQGGLLRSRIGSLDDERVAPTIGRVLLEEEKVTVLDVLSAGPRVAFQVRIDGKYAGGLTELRGQEGVAAALYATGMVDIEGSAIGRVQGVTDRYTMERRILSAAKESG